MSVVLPVFLTQALVCIIVDPRSGFPGGRAWTAVWSMVCRLHYMRWRQPDNHEVVPCLLTGGVLNNVLGVVRSAFKKPVG